MFWQIHYLTNYHATLLNRDDAGLAKRINFGGVPRLRVSSQSQKRHWREWITTRTNLPSGWRSRHFFSRILLKRLVDEGVDESLARNLVLQLARGILHAASQKDAVEPTTLAMKQPVLFGQPEADYFVEMVWQAALQPTEKDAETLLAERLKMEKKNLAAMVRQNGLDNPASGFEGALFGRFVTSDILARIDAPVHVAHAFTTHALDSEVDFFTVVDDLASDEETGAAHANDMELGAGLFYGYVVVDVPLLVSNLTGCSRMDWRDQEWQDVHSLLDLLAHAIAEVTPGAKLGSTAPYTRAQCIVFESGNAQPRSLANAFLTPITLGRRGEHPMTQSINAMADYLTAIERMYGETGERRYVASMHDWPRYAEPVLSLQDAIDGSLNAIRGVDS